MEIPHKSGIVICQSFNCDVNPKVFNDASSAIEHQRNGCTTFLKLDEIAKYLK